MKQEYINSLLNSFFISQEDLDNRKNFKEFTNSLSDIIIDEFAKHYLLNNPYLSVYLAHTDGSMLLKKIKTFLVYVLTEEVNEAYINRVHFIGSVHYSIKLEPAKVSYGFWALNEIINKMADVNDVVKENRSLISKILKLVEHLMNDGYYIQKDNQMHISSSQQSSQNLQDEIYLGLTNHKKNMLSIDLALKNMDTSYLKTISEKSEDCSLSEILDRFSLDKKYKKPLNIDAKGILKLHNQWHRIYTKFKKSLDEKDVISANKEYLKLEKITLKLQNILDLMLENFLEDEQLVLDSGMRAMQQMTELFYNKNFQNEDKNEILLSIDNLIRTKVLSKLEWVINEIDFDTENNFSDEYNIVRHIRYQAQDIFIGIKVKEIHRSEYLIEMINLLLEVFDLHLSVKERELSLIGFADKAEHANKSKDMFLANMSHELRTPLNAITGFSQILMMKKDTPDSVKKYVEKINIAGNNLLDLVNTILDFAKLESGKMQFNPSLSNISEILDETHTLVSPLADKKEISLKMPNIISLNLYMDKTLFKQVLINLLTNAIKFTPQSGKVSLSIVYDADRREYKFEVKDTGIGLSKDSISKLFQAFSQVENSYQKEQQGTGLGLMISKKIIEDLHNGKIWVESIEGQGSSFFISMPTPMIESHTYEVDNASENALSVLIVEDSENYQKLLIEHLKGTHRLILTDTVNKAKDLLSKNSYDFIILDFFLTDGISSEILKFMEEENISIPTIVISAEDEICISSSLSGSSNLECIINKNNIEQICASLRGEVV